jgi:hypothetical protein
MTFDIESWLPLLIIVLGGGLCIAAAWFFMNKTPQRPRTPGRGTFGGPK